MLTIIYRFVCYPKDTSGNYCNCTHIFVVEDIFWHNKDSFLILPELSFTFAVNFFKGEIYLQNKYFCVCFTFLCVFHIFVCV